MKTKNNYVAKIPTSIFFVVFLLLSASSLIGQSQNHQTDSCPETIVQPSPCNEQASSVFLVYQTDFCELISDTTQFKLSDESIKRELETHPDPKFRKLALFQNRRELDSLIAEICQSK